MGFWTRISLTWCCFPPICEGKAYHHMSVITLTPALTVYKTEAVLLYPSIWKLHFAWKPVLYLLLLPCTFLLLAACPYPFLRCTCVNKLCSALLCWDLPVGIQSCSRFVSVQTCNSKFRLAKDTWSWLCSCSCIPCIALHHAHVSPTVPPVCFTYVCKQLLHNVYACGHMGVQEWVMISMG